MGNCGKGTGILAMAGTAFLWSLAGLFIKLTDWNPIVIAGLRSLIAVIEPVFSPVWVFLAVGETPGLNTLIGGVAIVLAVATASVVSARRQDEETATPGPLRDPVANPPAPAGLATPASQ